MKTLGKSLCRYVASRSRTVRSVAHFIEQQTQSSGKAARDTYSYLKNCFINNGRTSPIDETVRKDVVQRFEKIDREVPIGSTPTDGLILAELLINCSAVGEVIECGCYAGGSSAKLSIITSLLGKRLTVFDSFEGLPVVDQYHLRDHHARRNDQWVTDWSASRYAARLDQVRGNVQRYGEVSVCHFVKGWFKDSLVPENLPEQIAYAFTDVDLANSARDCLLGLWPRLSENGVFISHDAAYIKVMLNLLDPDLWRCELKADPPIFFGAGFGLYDASPHLGYCVKGKHLSADYLKQLTLDK